MEFRPRGFHSDNCGPVTLWRLLGVARPDEVDVLEADVFGPHHQAV